MGRLGQSVDRDYGGQQVLTNESEAAAQHRCCAATGTAAATEASLFLSSMVICYYGSSVWVFSQHIWSSTVESGTAMV